MGKLKIFNWSVMNAVNNACN